jgi:hypothetical protein
LSARLCEFNAIEETQEKIKEKESERKSAPDGHTAINSKAGDAEVET